jgi:hypothetical protein
MPRKTASGNAVLNGGVKKPRARGNEPRAIDPTGGNQRRAKGILDGRQYGCGWDGCEKVSTDGRPDNIKNRHSAEDDKCAWKVPGLPTPKAELLHTEADVRRFRDTARAYRQGNPVTPNAANAAPTLAQVPAPALTQAAPQAAPALVPMPLRGPNIAERPPAPTFSAPFNDNAKYFGIQGALQAPLGPENAPAYRTPSLENIYRELDEIQVLFLDDPLLDNSNYSMGGTTTPETYDRSQTAFSSAPTSHNAIPADLNFLPGAPAPTLDNASIMATTFPASPFDVVSEGVYDFVTEPPVAAQDNSLSMDLDVAFADPDFPTGLEGLVMPNPEDHLGIGAQFTTPNDTGDIEEVTAPNMTSFPLSSYGEAADESSELVRPTPTYGCMESAMLAAAQTALAEYVYMQEVLRHTPLDQVAIPLAATMEALGSDALPQFNHELSFEGIL